MPHEYGAQLQVTLTNGSNRILNGLSPINQILTIETMATSQIELSQPLNPDLVSTYVHNNRVYVGTAEYFPKQNPTFTFTLYSFDFYENDDYIVTGKAVQLEQGAVIFRNQILFGR